MCLLLLSSCSNEEVYLYDRSDFLPSRQRVIDPYRNNPYRNIQQPYDMRYGGFVPNSRSYNNPYDFSQQQGNYPYYDTERYYVPPSYYRNVEPSYDTGGSSMKY